MQFCLPSVHDILWKNEVEVHLLLRNTPAPPPQKNEFIPCVFRSDLPANFLQIEQLE